MDIIKLICNIVCKRKDSPDIDYLTERIKILSNELSYCLGPIDIIEIHKTEVNPHHIITGYDMVIADEKYLTYDIKDWKTILMRLHRNLANKSKYRKSIWDCDNISFIYSSILSYSAYRAGLSKQPAFAIAWSNTHAFNLFIDNNNNVHIYEPQSGTFKGLLGNSLNESYCVKKIWFMI